MKFLIFLLIFAQISYSQDAVYLTKDSVTPFDGFLITAEKVNEFRTSLIERDSYKSLNDSLEKSLTMQQDINNNNIKKVNILLNQNDNLAINLADARSTSDWMKIGCFLLGMLTTLVGAIAISKVAK